MFKLTVLTILAIISASSAYDCSFGTSENIVEKLIKSCPRPLLDGPDYKYCCPRSDGEGFKCCNLPDFILTWSVPIVIFLVVLLVLSSLISIICCFCCPFCCVYKSRNGRVC